MAGFDDNVFINCPFDDDYRPMVRAMLFAIIDCGLTPRIASEEDDAHHPRIDKIKRFIKESKYGIHDISRMEPGLPRFNLSYELGLDCGCQGYGTKKFQQKKCLILDAERYRYQQVISDISGNDIKAHNDEPEMLVRRTREWLSTVTGNNLKSGTRIWRRYNLFLSHFDQACDDLEMDDVEKNNLPTAEYVGYIKNWINSNPD